MGNLKKCPVDMLEYIRNLPTGRVFVDDIAQIVWVRDDEGEIFPTTYHAYKYLIGLGK